MSDASLQRDQILSAYKAKPSMVREHYNSEVEDRKGYVGRPLLELLQNAEDALAEAGSEGRFVLAKRDAMLVAANEGASFSQRGLQSLCDRADSPKRRSPIYVGNKGTGFKAVLNWTDRPSVFSGNIAVQFDARESAKLIYESLGSGGLRELDADGPWPRECVPLLRVPLDASPTRGPSLKATACYWSNRKRARI